MFKRIMSASAAVGVAVLLSGCEMVTDITVNPDGETASVQSTMKINAAQAASMAEIDETSSPEKICEALNEEEDENLWKAEGEDCVSSAEMTLKFSEEGIEEFSTEEVSEEIVEVDEDESEILIESEFIEEEPDFTLKRIDDDVFFSMPVDGEETAEMVSMGVELTFNVTYPGKVLEVNNGGVISEDGKTATWLFSDLEGEDTIESLGSIKESSGVSTGLIIGGITVILLAGGIIWYVIYRKNQDEDDVIEEITVEEIS